MNTTVASSFNTTFLRNAQAHFERARILDPQSEVAEAFLEKVRSPFSVPYFISIIYRLGQQIQNLNSTTAQSAEDSEEEPLIDTNDMIETPKRKRPRRVRSS